MTICTSKVKCDDNDTAVMSAATCTQMLKHSLVWTGLKHTILPPLLSRGWCACMGTLHPWMLRMLLHNL